MVDQKKRDIRIDVEINERYSAIGHRLVIPADNSGEQPRRFLKENIVDHEPRKPYAGIIPPDSAMPIPPKGEPGWVHPMDRKVGGPTCV